jgi:hypothetical protein
VQFPCARCARTYEIADELVVGRAVKVACPACGNLAVHRVPAPSAAAPPPPPPQEPQASAFAEASDDDFDNALSALEAPAGAERPWPSPEPAAEPAPAPRAPADAGTKRPAASPAGPSRPAPPSAPLEEEEPVLVEAELVLRRSNQRARLTAALMAVAAVGLLVGGGMVALKWKRDAAPAGASRKSAEGTGTDGPAGGLSAADLAKLMGKKAPDPAEAAPARPVAAPRAEDRPKHEKLATGDKALLDLLSKKGDAAVTVQAEDATALATSRASLDEQAIEGTLSRNSGSFSACVSRAIAAAPDKKLPVKRVSLELTVRPSGRVEKAAVGEKAVAPTPLGQCIAQAAKRMVFPGFDGEAIDIVVPLKLQVTY